LACPTGIDAAYNALSVRKRIFDDSPTGYVNSPEASYAIRESILEHSGEASPKAGCCPMDFTPLFYE
jgi:hypothetical protein